MVRTLSQWCGLDSEGTKLVEDLLDMVQCVLTGAMAAEDQ